VEQPKVWVVNNAGHDFAPAQEFSTEMRYLTQGRVNVFNTERLSKEFAGKMRNYDSNDWILLSGSTILNCIAVAVALARWGRAKVLIFNAIEGRYYEQVIAQDLLH
jgi:NAD(P)-dependent dehydrogenase (short-subunit alcohol dehydrogenase family)